MSNPRFPRFNKFATNIKTVFSVGGTVIRYAPIVLSLLMSIDKYLPQVFLYVRRIIDAVGNIGLLKVLEKINESLQEEVQKLPEPPKSDEDQRGIRKRAERRRSLGDLGMTEKEYDSYCLIKDNLSEIVS